MKGREGKRRRKKREKVMLFLAFLRRLFSSSCFASLPFTRFPFPSLCPCISDSLIPLWHHFTLSFCSLSSAVARMSGQTGGVSSVAKELGQSALLSFERASGSLRDRGLTPSIAAAPFLVRRSCSLQLQSLFLTSLPRRLQRHRQTHVPIQRFLLLQPSFHGWNGPSVYLLGFL